MTNYGRRFPSLRVQLEAAGPVALQADARRLAQAGSLLFLSACQGARQQVTVRASAFTCEFAAGETIWTEACHKFRTEEIVTLAAASGFICDTQWTDEEWPFAESLLLAE